MGIAVSRDAPLSDVAATFEKLAEFIADRNAATANDCGLPRLTKADCASLADLPPERPGKVISCGVDPKETVVY
jgi:hypothetical protein